MAFVEDLTPFFSEFGETCTVDGVQITAIVDSPYTQALDVATSAWSLTCRAADVTTVVFNDTATVRSVSYRVVGIEPDGTGVTVLRLEKA